MAQMLGISKTTLRELRSYDEVPYLQIRRLVRYDPEVTRRAMLQTFGRNLDLAEE